MKKDKLKKEEEQVKMFKKLEGKVLFKLHDTSIYYGEVGYLNELGNIVTLFDNVTEEEGAKYKVVRHGFGAQLFDATPEGKFTSKYEGDWVRDKKQGKGKIVFKDGDIFEGNGTYIWNGKDKYVGEWKDGRMEGKGTFFHREGINYSGNFTNNHFINDKNILVNPFTPKLMIEMFNTKSFEYQKIKQANEIESFSIMNIFKINSNEFSDQVDECFRVNRIPLLILSEEYHKDSKNIHKYLSSLNKLYEEVYIRELYLKLEDSKGGKNRKVFEELKEIVVDTMVNGKFLSLNFDDSRVPYNKNSDVNLSVFYGNKMLSNFMWYPKTFFKYECSSNHLDKDPNLKLNKNFRFSIYSCLSFSYHLEDNEIVNIIEKRFSSALPLNRMNVLIIK